MELDNLFSDQKKKIHENKVFDELIQKVIKELETKEKVCVLEEDIQKEIDAIGDPWALGRLQKRARGTGLTIRSSNDSKQYGGKRTYIIYNRKISFVVCGS